MKNLSRRAFLKATALYGGAAATGAVLTGCGPTATPAAPAATPLPAPDLPFQVAPEAMNPFGLGAAEVDGVFFEGGYGVEYLKNAAGWTKSLHPGVNVNVTGAQKVADLLRPRFVAGNPPDVVDSGNPRDLDLPALIAEDQIADLAELMDAPALDTPGKKFKDTLLPGSQGPGIFDGKQRYINLTYTAMGVVYSTSLFEKYGYTFPETWDEMAALCEQIKKDGKMAPWTHQAKYPGYIYDEILFSLLYKAGGDELFLKIDNLEPDAWTNPAALRAIESIYMLYDKGWLLEGTAGMDHTQSQTAFLQGKAAFIPCGTWLENEMKTILPADFNAVVGLVPGYQDGKGSLKAVEANGGETYFVPAKAKNPKHGMEFLRVLMSKASARWFGENLKGIMAVVGGLEGAKVTPMMQSALDLGQSCDGAIILLNVSNWYKPVGDALEQNTTQLLTGKIKPAEFAAQIQKAADQVARDPDIKKYRRDS
jgi:N-acetylglucosamine transport system substrate-binding protein